MTAPAKYVTVRAFSGSDYLGSISVSPQGRRSVVLDGEFSPRELRDARSLVRLCFRPDSVHCRGESFFWRRCNGVRIPFTFVFDSSL